MIFQPAGELSRRALVLGELRGHDVGDTVTYEDLAALLDTPDRALIQSAVGAARKEFLRTDQRTVEAIPNVGYRIVEAADHIRLAKQRQARASRELVKSRDLVVYIDYNDLTPVERKMAEAMGYLLAQQSDFMRRSDIRHKNLERALDAITVEVAETKESQESISERLAAVEAKLADT
jgi:hypothetical protein